MRKRRQTGFRAENSGALLTGLRRAPRATGVAAALLLSACGPEAQADDPREVRAFVGGTVWDGTAADPLPNAAILVQDGRVIALGPVEEVDISPEAETIDLAGRWVVPGLINAHGHVGMARGIQTGPEAHTRENIRDQLALYARYGVTAVVSLGEPGYEGAAVRDEQQRDPAALDRARLFVAGTVMNPTMPAEAEPQVRERAERRVDWGKIRVDDFLGQTEKMDPATYAAVIRHSHEHGTPVTAHMVYLEDAKGLVNAGVDMLGHSVRDTPVDEELIQAMRARNVCLHPTLTREVSTFVYAERPEFFNDPFFLRDADPAVRRELESPERQAQFRGAAADYYRAALPTAERNMVALHEAGVRIAFGTDSGPPARFQGYFEHLELQMMQDAGMTSRDVLLSATSVAADCMRLEGLGTLQPGAWADFVVLRADPLADVRHLRQIDEVRVAGNPVPGARFAGQ